LHPVTQSRQSTSVAIEIVRGEMNLMNEVQGVTEIAKARAGIDVVLPVIENCIIVKGDVVFSPVRKFEG